MRPNNISQNSLTTAYNLIGEYFSSELGVRDPLVAHIRTITHAAFEWLKHQKDSSLENCLKNWQMGDHVYVEDQKTLISAVQSVIVSCKTPWKPAISLESLKSKIQRLVFRLIRGDCPSVKELLQEPALLKAILWKRDPVFLQEARELLKSLLEEMGQEAIEGELSEEASFHLEMMIGDLLSLYPYFRPEDGEKVGIPLRVQGKWQWVEYRVERLLLTREWMGSPLVALGLNPEGCSSVPPLLVFKGTTYPTDEGFVLSLLTDLNPGASVGSYAFYFGQQKIKDWLEVQTDQGKRKALVYGKSLGGAQAWRTKLYFPKQVERVMAYGAPGFSSADLRRWKELLGRESHPNIQMFYQKNDLIPYVGLAAESGIDYYQVLGNQPVKGFFAHAFMHSIHERSSVIRLQASQEAKRWERRALNFLHSVVSIGIFPLLLLVHATQSIISYSIRSLDRHVIKVINGSRLAHDSQ